MPRTPNSPKYARSFRTWAEFRLNRSASSCEEMVLTPSSSSCWRQRVYTERRRTVISGIRGILSWERRVMLFAGVPGAARNARSRLLDGLDEQQDRGDDEHIQRQRFDERQADDHDGLDASGGGGLARDGFRGGGRRKTLTHAAETRGDAHAQTCRQHREGPHPTARAALSREGQAGNQENRPRYQGQLQ